MKFPPSYYKRYPFWLATRILIFTTLKTIINRIPWLSNYIISFRHGYCSWDKGCSCCDHSCPYLNNEGGCKVFEDRIKLGTDIPMQKRITCNQTPYPTDIWFIPKFKNCTYYYKLKENTLIKIVVFFCFLIVVACSIYVFNIA